MGAVVFLFVFGVFPPRMCPPGTWQVMMRWNERPRRALVLLKPEQEMLPLAAQTIDFLQREIGLKVMVEAAAAEDVGQVCVCVCV